MKRAQSRSNLDIVQGYLKGERPFVQVGYTQELTPRNDGETWQDSQGNSWIMENGHKKQVNKKTFLTDIIKFNCKDCGFNIRMLGTKADEKCFYRSGRCYSCEVHNESLLMQDMNYVNNLKIKNFKYELSVATEIKTKLEEALTFLKSNKTVTYHNDDGGEEHWSDTTRKEKTKLIKKDLKEANKAITRINLLLESLQNGNAKITEQAS